MTPQMIQMDGVFDCDVEDPSLYSRAPYSGRPFSVLPETVSQEWDYATRIRYRVIRYLSNCGMNKRMLHIYIHLS